MNSIKYDVLMVEPTKHPKIIEIPRSIEVIKFLISKGASYICDIKATYLQPDVCLISNEDGALLGLKGNRCVKGEITAGNFLIVELDNKGRITSLSNELRKKYMQRFWDIETYTDDEVSASYWSIFEHSTEDE